MADLFPEIEKRMRVARAYEAWAARRPWRWLPGSIRPQVFRKFLAQREVRKIDG